MESNHKSGDGLTGTQKEATLRALIQRTGYNLIQVGTHGHVLSRAVSGFVPQRRAVLGA